MRLATFALKFALKFAKVEFGNLALPFLVCTCFGLSFQLHCKFPQKLRITTPRIWFGYFRAEIRIEIHET